MREAFRAEVLRVLPNTGIAVSEINGVKHPFPRGDAPLRKFHLFYDAAIANVDRWIQAQTFFNDLIKQWGFFQ